LPMSSFDTAMAILSHVSLGPLIRKLVQSGVPDLLANGPIKAAELAPIAGLHPLSLERVLRALTAFGIFTEVAPGAFANNETSSLLRDRPGGLRNWALFVTSDQFVRSAAALGYSLETGEAAHDHVFGQTVWEYLRDHPDESLAFNRGLAEIRKEEHREIAKAYYWTGVNTVLDIGGGAGSLLSAILETHPEINGILFDSPEVLPDADTLLTRRGVRDRCTLIGGTFFDSIGATGERWILSQVLHDWPDAACHTILQRCQEQMRTGDRLLIVEMIPVPAQPSLRIAIVDIGMMQFAGEARQRTVEEYKSRLEATGLELLRVLPTSTDFSIIEARSVAQTP
jgi:hypothetical protein